MANLKLDIMIFYMSSLYILETCVSFVKAVHVGEHREPIGCEKWAELSCGLAIVVVQQSTDTFTPEDRRIRVR